MRCIRGAKTVGPVKSSAQLYVEPLPRIVDAPAFPSVAGAAIAIQRIYIPSIRRIRRRGSGFLVVLEVHCPFSSNGDRSHGSRGNHTSCSPHG
jgi:hypothetical protein